MNGSIHQPFLGLPRCFKQVKLTPYEGVNYGIDVYSLNSIRLRLNTVLFVDPQSTQSRRCVQRSGERSGGETGKMRIHGWCIKRITVPKRDVPSRVNEPTIDTGSIKC